MRVSHGLRQLVDAIYGAAIDPDGWPGVMAAMRRRFSSAAEPFYVLDLDRHEMRPLCAAGIEPGFVASFDECYFTADNPWLAADPLHRPGVVRTDRALHAFHRDARVLHRSTYYDTWLRPQRLEHSLGTTVLDEGGLRANITLLRGRDAGPYDGRDVAGMDRLGRHLRRALRMSRRLELLTVREAASHAALDRLPHGVLLLDGDGRLLHANRPGEALLRAGDALRCRDGRLVAADARDQVRLDALLDIGARGGDGADSLVLRRAAGGRLLASAMPLPRERAALPTSRAALLVALVDPDAIPAAGVDRLRRLHGLTGAETRLATALVGGVSLRRAGAAAGITYETARWYLKVLFQKTGTNRQTDLVARLLRDIAACRLD
jgi:DNA-binding CsgD family transcriptional regulator